MDTITFFTTPTRKPLSSKQRTLHPGGKPAFTASSMGNLILVRVDDPVAVDWNVRLCKIAVATIVDINCCHSNDFERFGCCLLCC